MEFYQQEEVPPVRVRNILIVIVAARTHLPACCCIVILQLPTETDDIPKHKFLLQTLVVDGMFTEDLVCATA